MPARKSTGFMSSSVWMLKQLSKRCPGDHVHQPLEGGRAFAASFYSLELVKAMLRGIRDTADHEARIVEAREEARMLEHVNTAMPSEKTVDGIKGTPIPMSDGTEWSTVYWRSNFRDAYKDEYTNEVLRDHLISAAVREELDYFNKHVWRLVDKSEVVKDPNHKIIKTRFVNCNKGDHDVPDCRARLVCQEVNTYKSDEFYASTPPLEAKRMLFSRYSSERTRGGKALKISFVDIRKAYFNALPKRLLHVFLPKELGVPKDKVGELLRCVYGTRDAGQLWEETYADFLVSIGFIRGIGSPCCFFHPTRNLSVVVHGDDFTCLGVATDLDWYEKQLSNPFEIKVRGRIGEEDGDDREVRILNRIVRLGPGGLRYEADPRHAELIIKSLGLTSGTSVSTPGVKEHDPEIEAIKDDGMKASAVPVIAIRSTMLGWSKC